MIKRRRFPKIFFGWWILLVAGVWSGLGLGFKGFGISVFFKPLAAELGLSRAATSVAAGISGLEGSLEAPLTGWLCDKFGPRWPIFIGTCIMATGLVLMNFINSLWAFYLVWGVMVGMGMGIINLPIDKGITEWFVKKRGIAQGTRWVLPGVLLLPIVTWLIVNYGWRVACIVGGLSCCQLAFPLSGSLLNNVDRNTTSYYLTGQL